MKKIKYCVNLILDGIASFSVYDTRTKEQVIREAAEEADSMSLEELEAANKRLGHEMIAQFIAFFLIVGLMVLTFYLSMKNHAIFGILTGIATFALLILPQVLKRK